MSDWTRLNLKCVVVFLIGPISVHEISGEIYGFAP